MKKLSLKVIIPLVAVFSFALGGFVLDEDKNPVTVDLVISAGKHLFGLDLNVAEADSLLGGLQSQKGNYESNRKTIIPNEVYPCLIFNPVPPGYEFPDKQSSFKAGEIKVKLPKNRDVLAFYSVRELSELIKTQQITSLELTQFFLERIRKYGSKLECVITLTEDLALEQAKKADEEIKAGNYKGLLHGIPYGVKDLFAKKGYKTTWGATPYKDQVLEADARVVQKLEEAGAVMAAKLTLGALAMGDVWYGGKTRNPWNYEQGSSGSSAGSASSVAAGLLPFTIGTETYGSIVSPSTRCGVTGLRPTFGRVSRTGAMALSWSMDKVGPIAKTVEDCAIVFNAIQGPDEKDPFTIDAPFDYNSDIDIKKLKIGYLKTDFEKEYGYKAFDEKAIQKLQEMGIELKPIELPDVDVNSLIIILTAEGAAAFDELTLSGKDDELVRQTKGSWPNLFRQARFIPAVEYIQANRIRTMLMQQMDEVMKDVDVIVAPTYSGKNLLMTNLTGYPAVVLPNGFTDKGSPVSMVFLGKLFGEAKLLAVAKAYQDATDFHLEHPKLVEK